MDRCNKAPPQEYLAHYGVKGMKWGIRRTPEQLGHKPTGKKAGRDHKNEKKQGAKTNRRKVRKDRQKAVAAIKAHLIEMAKMPYNDIGQNQINSGENFAMQHLQQMQQMQFQQWMIQESNRAASLSLTGGMNPFMFG